MYFNRHNAQPKNWRMYKKGKTFLYGCSLVLATGIVLSAPSLSVSAESPQAADQGATAQSDQDPLAAQPAAQSSETTAAAPSKPVPAPQPVAVEAKAPHLDPIAKTGLVWSGSLTPEDFLTNSADLKAQGASISFATGTSSPDASSVSLVIAYPDGTKTLIQVPLTQLTEPAETASSPAPESPEATNSDLADSQAQPDSEAQAEADQGKRRVKREGQGIILQEGQRKIIPAYLESKNILLRNGKDGLYVTEITIDRSATNPMIKIVGGYKYQGGNGANQTIVLTNVLEMEKIKRGQSVTPEKYVTTVVNLQGIWKIEIPVAQFEKITNKTYEQVFATWLAKDSFVYPKSVESTYGGSWDDPTDPEKYKKMRRIGCMGQSSVSN